MINWEPLILTFQLAGITTVLLFFLALPLAYWLAYTKSKLKPVIETLVSMPLVLPPTVLGFYLLLAFSPSKAFGQWLDQWLGIRLIFSFEGACIGFYPLQFAIYGTTYPIWVQ